VTAEIVATRPPVAELPRSGQRLLRLGLGGALTTLIGGALLRTLAGVPFLPVDESANVAYAMEVTHGHIPLAGRHRIQVDFPGQRLAAQHASNHPPLYHAIVGPILRFSLYLHHPTAGIVAARLVNLLFTIVTVLLAAWLAWSLTAGTRRPIDRRQRAMFAVGTAGLTGALPHLVTASAIVENDTLATALVLGAVVMLVRIVVLGRTTARIVGLTLFAATASVTRVTSVPAVLIICAVLGLAGLFWPHQPDQPPLRRLGSASWPPAVVLVMTAAVAGWFLVLNQRRYGDWSGGKAVASLVKSHEPGAQHGEVHYLLDRFSYLLQLQQIVGGPDSRHGAFPHSTRPLALVLAGLLGVGLVMLVIKVAARRVRIDARLALCVAFLVVLLCASMGEIAVHATGGGIPHGRYLLPAAGAFLTAGAACLLAYPLRLGPLAIGAAICLECWGTLKTFTVQLHRHYPTLSATDALRAGLHDMDIPDPTVALIILLAVMALGVLLQFGALFGINQVGRRPAADPVVADLTP
jgi:hypothetical protein